MKADFVLVLLGLGLLGCAHAYESPQYGFSISEPAGWSEIQNSYVLAVFEAPGTDGYLPRISLNVIDQTRSSIDAVMGQIKSNYFALFTDFVIVAEENLTIKNLPARRLDCRWKQGIYDLSMTEILIQKLNRYYDFGLIAVDEDYEAALQLFLQALESLKIGASSYQDESSGVGLSCPSGWVVDDQSLPGMVFVYGPEANGFITNIVLASEPSSLSLQEYLQSQKSQVLELLTDAELLEEGRTVIPSGTWWNLVYRYRIPGPVLVKARAEITMKNGVAYSLVYTAPASAYDAHLPEFQDVVASFSVVEGAGILGFALAVWLLRELV